MSEIERLHQQRMAREAERAKRPKEHRDPAEWRPKDNRDYERADANVKARQMQTEDGLRYHSLADMEPHQIAGIEAAARADLIRAMERAGLTPDERGVRMRWTLHAVGYGFPYPEGFVHPEAPDDIKQAGREAWKRVVEIASDSVSKFLYVKVWRRKERAPMPLPAAPKAITSGLTMTFQGTEISGGSQGFHYPEGLAGPAVPIDDVVDAEIVVDDDEFPFEEY